MSCASTSEKKWPELVELAGSNLQQGDFHEIINILEGKLPQNLSEIDMTNKNIAIYGIGYNNLGIAYLRTKKHEKAIDALNKCKDALPRWPAPYYLLGQAYFELKKYSMSIDNFEKALSLRSEDADGVDLTYLMISYLKIHQREKAIKIFDTMQKKFGDKVKNITFSSIEAEAENY